MTIPRTYPLRRPENHKPPIPRWSARFPSHVDRVFIAYIGIQAHSPSSSGASTTGGEPAPAFIKCTTAVETWLSSCSEPVIVEKFQLLDDGSGSNTPHALIFACYWDDATKYNECISSLDLSQLHGNLETTTATRDQKQKEGVGLWCETFTADVSRLETNYSGLDCLPGLARLPGTQTVAHELTGYWGAARDRIPDSGWDNFTQDLNPESHHAGYGRDFASMSSSREEPEWCGKVITGSNPHNLVYIRSGQFWANCEEAERRLYEERLEPTLRKGLAYLWENPAESGAMALRYLSATTSGLASSSASAPPVSTETSEGGSNESCVTGFFRNLTDLESWAKQHASHLAIYTGALRHAKTFGDKRRFRTWHEVAVLRGGEARFEYVNCPPGTGVMGCRDITLMEAGR